MKPEPAVVPTGSEDRPVILVIDVQGNLADSRRDEARDFPMRDYNVYMLRIPELIGFARQRGLPLVYIQEVHHPSRIDFGRELDGFERVHCLEDNPATAIAPEVDRRGGDFWVRKRRYSAFFGTDLDILLQGLAARTLWLVGGFTDVCVHYTFADAHQRGYRCRVIEDCVAGSSLEAHRAALAAMDHLQPGCCVVRDSLLGAKSTSF